MFPGKALQTAKFDTRCFPQYILLLTVGENLMPMGYWTVISKDPFRFLICMGVGNHSLLPADELQHTRLVEGADSVFETVVYRELPILSREFVPFVLDMVAVYGERRLEAQQPILYLSQDSFATLGESWEYLK